MLLVGLVGMTPAFVARARAAELSLHGDGLEARAARTVLAPALAAPGDSAALSAALGSIVVQLEERGHAAARARGRWIGTERLEVTIAAGPRSRLTSVRLRATPAADSARFAAALDLAPGGWTGPRAVGDAVANAVTRLVHDGYAHAELGISEWAVDSTGAHVTLGGVLGPRVIVEAVRIDGLKVTRPAFARRALGPLIGRPYRPEAEALARERLLQLGLFRSVELGGLESAGDWSRGTLVYRAEELQYNRFEGVIGTQGGAGSGGTVGTANLELGNLLGTGRGVVLRWDGRGHGADDLTARYTEPLVGGLPLRLEAALEQEVRDSTYTSTRWGARAHWALTVEDGVEFGLEEQRVVEGGVGALESRLENTVFGLERTTFDDALSPRRGLQVHVEGTQSFKREALPAGNHTARASAVEGGAEWIRPLRPSSGVSLDLRGAGRFSSEPVLPVFERYPLGGAASLRGFDEEAFRVDHYALSRLEWRWYVGSPRQRVYLFWDHAWAETRVATLEGGTRWDTLQKDGVGFGLRLDTAAGLAGIDYGLEPGRAPLDGKIHLRLISNF